MRTPVLERLEAPRLLAALALAPLLAPLKALPDEEARLAEAGDALGAGLGRLAPAEGAGRAAGTVLAEGRALPLAAERPLGPESQPRACWLATEVDAAGVPLRLRRLWSGCHFCWAPVEETRAPAVVVLTLAFRFTLTVRSISISTSP